MAGGDESIYAPEASRPSIAGIRYGVTGLVGADHPDTFAAPEGFYWRLKRPIGLLLTASAGLLVIPALLLITLILMRQGRPVFIRRKRLGLYGQPFTTYHFRTMSPDSLLAFAGDEQSAHPYVFGRLLTRTNLDRLPLLWNVLRGDMNIVGPRPLSQEELFGSGRAARHSLSVRPGLTGLWKTDFEPDLRRRLALDRSYIERASPLLDLKILLRTLILMHGGR